MRRNPACVACVALMLAGCAVGPDYRTPEAPAVQSFTGTALPPQTEAAPVAGGDAQRFDARADIPAEWWTLYRSEALDKLVRMSLAGSPTLDAARAALRQAQETLSAQTGVLYPGVDAAIGARRQRTSGASFGQAQAPANVFTLYNASVNVSYAIDVAGGARRELEALRAQVDSQRFQLEAARLTLSANVVTTAIQEASLRAQANSLRAVIAAQEKTLAVAERQFELGAIARADLLAQRALLAQSRASLPPLDKARAQARHALAALVGRFPADAELPVPDLAKMTLPQELPLSLPSELVRRRPDIRAAEALLHRASARIGVAAAAAYPQLTLSAAYGSAALASGDLAGASSRVWNFGANLLQPIFHGGQIAANKRAAVAVYDQAFAQYRQTVLAAFQNVADVLAALEDDARALNAQAQAEAAARETLELVNTQFEVGAASHLALLNAERQYQQANIALVQARAARYADTAALFQALGGGWWQRGAAPADAPGSASGAADQTESSR